MLAAQFVVNLAQVTGFEETELRTVDRVLALAGLRAKARGRDIPDVTCIEGFRLLLATMAARNITRAVDELHDVARFRLMAHGVTVEKGSPDALPELIGLSVAEIEELPLIDALARMAAHLAKGGDAGVCLKVILGGPVMIQVKDEAFTGELQFTGAMDHLGYTDVRRTVTVSRRTLEFIGKNCLAD